MRTWIPLAMACALLGSCSSDPKKQEKDLGDQTDMVGDAGETSLPTSCEGLEGEPCTDGDPCHPEPGVCLGGECFYEEGQTTQCDTPPDECSAGGQCNPEGGCLWELADGWCRIGGQCVSAGTSEPGNPCRECVPDQNRGDWSPVSGPACEPPENPCTDQGKCEQGFCVAVAGTAECASDADCVKKDDGDRCNGLYVCDECQCVYDEESVVTCPTEENTPCAQSACNPLTGKCSMQVAADGTTCDDGEPCTSGDACVGGECQPGTYSKPKWEQGAPADMAYLTSVRVVPGTPPVVYAVGAGGVVYSSQDLGQSFQASDLLADGGKPGDWLFVSSGAVRSILAIFGEDLFVSTNTGLSYEKKLTGCKGLAQASSSTLDSPVYVAVCQGGLYASQDKGTTWAMLPGSHLPNGATVTGLAAKDTQLVFLGTRGEDGAGRGYVYRTQDGGNSWSQVDPPDRPNQAYVSHRGLMMSTQSPDRLYVGYSNIQGKPFDFGTMSLFRSEDAGNSFMALNPNFSGGGAVYVPLALDSIGRLILGVDSHLSRGGSFGTGPWGQIPDPTPPGSILLHSVHSAAVHPVNDFSFFVPGYEGVAMASDLGAKWTLLSKGLDGVQLAVMARCADGKTIYAQDRLSRGVLRSVDGGASFARLSIPADAAGKEYVAALCSPANAASAWFFGAGGSVLSTKNGGQQFTFADEKTGLVLGGPQRIGLSAASPGQLFEARQGLGLFRSEDGANPAGSGFKATGPAEAYVSAVLSDPFEQGRVYVGIRAVPPLNEARLYTCTDLGSNCSLKLTVPVDAGGTGQDGFSLFADAGFPGRVFAAVGGLGGKVYYTSDYGNSWSTFVDLPLLSMRGRGELLPDPTSKGSFFAAFTLGRVYRYDEPTTKWSVLDGSPVGVTSLAWGGAQPGTTLLAGSGLEPKIYVSNDQGATWSVHKDFGLTDYHVQRVVAEQGFVFALLQGKGKGDFKLFVNKGTGFKEAVLPSALADVAVQVASENKIMALGRFGGAYQSTTGGEQFQSFGSLDSAGLDLAVKPDDSNVLFAAVDCGVLPGWYDQVETFLGADCGVRRSIDGGQTWFTVLNVGKPCVSVAVSQQDPNYVFAACPGDGVYRSMDGGDNWSQVTGWPHLQATALVVADEERLYVGTTGRGVSRGTIDFATGIVGGFATALSDGARTVSPVGQIRVEVDPNNSSRVVVAAVPGGIGLTESFGDKWRDVTDRLGPDPAWVGDTRSLSFVPRYLETPDGQELWVMASGRGIYMSRDHGAHWVFDSAGSLPLSKSHPVELWHDPDHAGYVWLGTLEGAFRTADAGTMWQKIETGLPAGGIEAMLPQVGGLVYAAVTGAGVYSVQFDGASWQKTAPLGFFGQSSKAFGGRLLALWHAASGDPAQDKSFLLGMDPFGLYATIDGGMTFQPTGAGLPAGPVYALARSPVNGQLVVAGTAGGLYQSTDGGATFALLSEPAGQLGACFSVAFDGEDAGTLYALCTPTLPHGRPTSEPETQWGDRVFYVSADSGATFEGLGEGLEGKVALQVASAPETGGRVFVVTSDSGVLASQDGGATFTPYSTGLPSLRTAGNSLLHSSALLVSPDNLNLVVGTDGFGAWRRVMEATCE